MSNRREIREVVKELGKYDSDKTYLKTVEPKVTSISYEEAELDSGSIEVYLEE